MQQKNILICVSWYNYAHCSNAIRIGYLKIKIGFTLLSHQIISINKSKFSM